MLAKVSRLLEWARDDLTDATREPPGPVCLLMKRHYRERARLQVKLARAFHRRSIREQSSEAAVTAGL